MNYPDDFNIPTFTAGKNIATSRAMGIGIMSGFLVVIFLAGALIWTIRSMRVEPYILATGGINDEWHVVVPTNERPKIKMTSGQIVQQSLIWKFVQNWFSISNEPDVNATLWNSSCQYTDCETFDAVSSCKIFCAVDEAVFRRFDEDILPIYQELYNAHTYWSPVVDSINITPVGRVGDAGGTWRIQMLVATSNNETMRIMAYAKVVQSKKFHPSTMGYYIKDFNAYRID